MEDETDTLGLEPGTDNVEPSADDTAEDWDFFDPETDTDEAPEPEATEDEEGETAEQPDGEEEPAEDSTEEQEDDQPPAEASQDAVVTLADGSTTTVAELAKGHMRQADYTRKSQELANQRTTVTAQAEQLANTLEAFIDFVSASLPAAPDANLAYTDPNKYVAQKAQHDAAMAKVQELVALGQKPKDVTSAMSENDRRDLIARENASLAEAFPETATQQGRAKFFGDVQKVASDLGFSNEELSQVTDHRIFALAHWAQKGKAAEAAKATARTKVKAAAPAKPNRPAKGAAASGNRDAMSRLMKSGSLEDAALIDFD